MSRLISTLFSITLFFTLFSCDTEESVELETVRTGAELLVENYLDELDGKRVGLVMNPTSRIGETHMLDTLMARGVNVQALYAPEHGFRGEAGAGEIIEDGIDQETGLPVFSLYGSTRKPTAEMLNEVDLLLFDMQDVGARFYTYIATLGLVMEAASESDIPVWVLDRPNPLGGEYVSGWVLEEEFKSFVGPYPIPVAHGLTMGEMAQMIAGEEWMDFANPPDLRVIEMEGWNRDMLWPETGLNWVAPSPNLATFEQAYLYPGTVFFEGTSMSEGRGTDQPFLILGDPNTNLPADSIRALNEITDQLQVNSLTFTPRSIPGAAATPKHMDLESFGIQVKVNGFDFDPVRMGLELFATLVNATPDVEINNFLYNLAGTREIDKVISGELDPLTLDFNTDEFKTKRTPYLLYD
ncbi:DUF1343 domain-containing protein [Rhodohalobacter sp.]|uniref:exo-beta-N-acetylmuramidase NamZ family protein n=1 Tax=Rhodohalobacter sp. TaxID=1974210 RepID=UPI002ACEA57E|nr:DUF1343 domain-containing protein [Rhodohalobacter sp.]MDZ7756660.1 DUF1343 domain-containing protein [Rhodohalobacter sp.]